MQILEKLTQKIESLLSKIDELENHVDHLQNELMACRAAGEAKDGHIKNLEDERSRKELEMEQLVAKIEGFLGK